MIRSLPTRAAGLARLQAFLPNSGSRYASERNHDGGPDARDNVSMLSPYLRHRLLTEAEVIAAVRQRFAFSSAEKFIQEVCWRTYWKGWLELHPQIWSRYSTQLAALALSLGEGADGDEALRAHWCAAVEGRTGIECFDHWSRELVATGYLHNHTRMWFASIWIFTLNLPWQLGADFFLRHLLDGDPASNTLSWRWVGGLQTRGKHYLARADNIRKYTNGRWWPKGVLNELAAPLPADPVPEAQPLAAPALPVPGLRTALWLGEDDLHPESLAALGETRLLAIAGDVAPGAARSPLPLAEIVSGFAQDALADALARGSRRWSIPAQRVPPAESMRWCREHGIEQLLMPYAPVGPGADAQRALVAMLAAHGQSVVRLRRDWDSAFWPHAGKGFFQLRKRIQPLLQALGLP